MTAPAAAAARGAATRVTAGPVTDAERARLAAKVNAARAQQSPAASPPRPSSPPAVKPAPAASKPPQATPPSRPATRRPLGRLWGAETPGQSVAGVLLALIAWGWIGLPLIQGGPDQVRNVLRAKFFNKGPDGEWLP